MRNYWKNISIQSKISLPIIAFIIILVISFLYFFIYVKVNEDAIQENTATIQKINDLSTKALVLQKNIYINTLYFRFDRENQYKENILSEQAEMTHMVDEMKPLLASPDSQELLTEFESTRTQVFEVRKDLINAITKGDTETINAKFEMYKTLQETLDTTILTLTNYNLHYLERSSSVYKNIVFRLSVIGLGLGLITLFLVIVFFVYLRKIITQPIKTLSETAEEITKGNFNVNLSSDTNDELGILARNLLTMSAKLSDYYRHLESQVMIKENEIRRNKAFEEQKDDFMNTASHELKTPITSLKIYNELMNRLANKNGHVEYSRYLTKIDDQIRKITNLISSLLDITKMQSGLQFDMKQFDIFHSVQETIEVMKVTSKTHEIVLTGSTTKTVYGDENRIGQVLTNLLSNAIKYSPGKQKIVVSISERRRGIAITIQDFGIGIDDTNKQKIFDKFYRVAGGDERTFPGLGIGLYICREIVARHKGKLWVESKKGEGSIFYMVIPYSPEGPTLS